MAVLARMTGALVVALTIALALPSPGAAQQVPESVREVYDDFSSDGKIDPCEHTAQELRDAEQSLPDELEKLAPQFPAAVADALEQRDRCDEQGGDATPTPTPTETPTATPTPSATESGQQPPPAATATPTPPPPPAPTPAPTPAAAPATADDDEDVPIAGIALAALALAVALAALTVLLMSRGEAGEERMARLRHTWGEAAYRAGGAWMDFKDWVRLGR